MKLIPTWQVRDTDTGKVVRWHALWKQLEQWCVHENRCEGRRRYVLEPRGSKGEAVAL
jgi:hypothetical protein